MTEIFCLTAPTKPCSGCVFARNAIAKKFAQATGMNEIRAGKLDEAMFQGDPAALDAADRLRREAVDIVAMHCNTSQPAARLMIAEHCPKATV